MTEDLKNDQINPEKPECSKIPANPEKTKKMLWILSLTLYAMFLTLIISQVMFGDPVEAKSIIPLTNLRQPIHVFLFTIVWPLIGGLISIFIGPKILVPVYLKLKTIFTHRTYDNCILELNRPINSKLLFKRAAAMFLLVMGLVSAIMPIISDYLVYFYMESQIGPNETPEYLYPYSPQAFIVLVGMIFPFALLLWSLVWTLQDSGLVHYQLSSDPTKYQEIEPVYFKISGIVKGFAGISAIFFYITAIFNITKFTLTVDDETNTFIDKYGSFFWVVLVSAVVMIWSCPFIMLHYSRKTDWVTKDIKKMARIQVEDLKIE